MMRMTEVDGVPTLVAPKSGQMTVGLIFRVGVVDESLPIAGITHMVEHLALHRHGVADYHYNGTTCSYHTSFHMQGSESDVVSYLTGVCESLADLPMQRLETEKTILRTEAAGRGQGANRSLPLWRYGARTHGVVSYPEWGVHRLQPADLEQWAQTWFTRDNAVLWIAGNDVPSGLKLRLPGGRRMPVPTPASALPVQPASFCGDDGRVVMDAIVTESTAAHFYAGVLERELFRSLRQEGGYSYTAATSYDSRGDGYATITAVADSLPKMQDAVLGGFVDVLAKLEAGRIEEQDLNALRGQAMEAYDHPEVHAARLAGQAVNFLTGQRVRTLDEVRADVAAVTTARLHEVAVAAGKTMLLQAPSQGDVSWAGFTPAPVWSATWVDGVRYPAHQTSSIHIIVGADGVSQTSAEGAVTVRYAECEALLAWPDGARRLLGADGINVHIEPTLYEKGAAAIPAIDGAVPPSKVVPMPAREPGSIPQPEVKRSTQKERAVKRGRIFAIVAGVATVALWYFMITMANAWTPRDGELAEKAIIALMFLAIASTITFTALLVGRIKNGHW